MMKFEFNRPSKKEDTINMLSIMAQLIQRLTCAEAGGFDELLELDHMQQLYKDYFSAYTRSNDERRVLLILTEKGKEPLFSAEQEKSNQEAFAKLGKPKETSEKQTTGPPAVNMSVPPSVVSTPKHLPKGAVHHAMAPVELEFWDMCCMASQHVEDHKFSASFDSFFKFFKDKMIVEKVAGSMFLFNVTLYRSESHMTMYPHGKDTVKVFNLVGRPLDIDNDDDDAVRLALYKEFREKFEKEPTTQSDVEKMFRLIFQAEAHVLTPHFFKPGTIMY
jgi:hypothetical protein